MKNSHMTTKNSHMTEITSQKTVKGISWNKAIYWYIALKKVQVTGMWGKMTKIGFHDCAKIDASAKSGLI